MSAINDIAVERHRQIAVEGWTPEHDDQHDKGELAMAAALYATPRELTEIILHENGNLKEWRDPWPWQERNTTHRYHGQVMKRVGFKRHDRRHKLVIAAALIVAEIERLDRAAVAYGNTADYLDQFDKSPYVEAESERQIVNGTSTRTGSYRTISSVAANGEQK